MTTTAGCSRWRPGPTATLKFLAALGNVEGVHGWLDANAGDLAAVNEAFLYTCYLRHATTAAPLLDRAIRLDAEMGRQIDGGPGRSGLIQYFIAHKPDVHNADPAGRWQAYIKQRIGEAMVEGDLTTFSDGLRREPSLLSDAAVTFQARLVELGILNDRAGLIDALFELDLALLHTRVPPKSSAVEFAFVYAKAHLLPRLLRVWPLPDDLVHAAGVGDLARVQRWFDADGKPALGDLAMHFPINNAHYCWEYVN
jgi:hypothetical protein